MLSDSKQGQTNKVQEFKRWTSVSEHTHSYPLTICTSSVIKRCGLSTIQGFRLTWQGCSLLSFHALRFTVGLCISSCLHASVRTQLFELMH